MPKPKPIHILYIRNEGSSPPYLQQTLEARGYRVDVAASREEGMWMSRQAGYDIVIVDQIAPVERGLEVVQLLSATAHQSPSTIVVAGSGQEHIAAEAIRLGASDYIIKDSQGGYLELFDTVIKQVLQQRRLALQKRQAEETVQQNLLEIEQAKQEWEATLDSFSELICLLDEQGRVVRANLTVERWDLAKVTEVKGRDFSKLLGMGQPWSRAWSTVQQGQSFEFEYEDPILKRPLHVQVRPLSTQTTRRDKLSDSFAAAIIKDISRRKADEIALQRHAQELKARNDDLDAFAHTVAHDLQNPLGLIIGFASALDKYFEVLTAEEKSLYLQKIKNTGHKMSNIIKELLLLASVHQEKITFEAIDMADLLSEAQKRLALLIQENEAEVIVPEAWPSVVSYAPWVEEVWVNYISNAIKYGGRPPRLILGAGPAEDNMVRFWIQDNGRGLTVEEQNQLFKPFTRLHKGQIQGHGLGLSIVQRIVNKLGGEVAIQSDGIPGQGTVFSFTLPAAHSEKR